MITKNFRHIFAAFSVGCGFAATVSALSIFSALRHPALKPEITCPKCTGSRSFTKSMPCMWSGII